MIPVKCYASYLHSFFLIRLRVHIILKAKAECIHSNLAVLKPLTRFSGVGFNFPADKDISHCFAGI